MFYFEDKPLVKNKIVRNYRNPIFLAKKYRQMIDSGIAKNEADLARKLNISRVRVNHFMSLFKLAPEVIEAVESLGDPMAKRYISERKLRAMLKLSGERQIEVINKSIEIL